MRVCIGMAKPSLLLLLCGCFSMGIQIVESKKDTDADSLPLYWGWFVESDYSSSFLSRSNKLLADTLQKVPDFLKDVQSFTKQEFITDILLHYTRENADEVLHCTAMYNGVDPDYTPGAEEYANRQIVKDNANVPTVLHSVGWILTPRTFGARIKLTESQLSLWNSNDTEGNPKQQIAVKDTKQSSLYYQDRQRILSKENTTDQDPSVLGNFQPTSGFGSRAHLTLGCSPGVGAVTTGYDLVDLIRLEILNSSDVKTYDLPAGGGWLRNYGEGQWVFYPTKQWLLESTFQGYDTSNSRQLVVSLGLMCLSCALAIMFPEKF